MSVTLLSLLESNEIVMFNLNGDDYTDQSKSPIAAPHDSIFMTTF